MENGRIYRERSEWKRKCWYTGGVGEEEGGIETRICILEENI